MLTGRTKLYTASVTVAAAVLTVGLMVGREYLGSAASPHGATPAMASATPAERSLSKPAPTAASVKPEATVMAAEAEAAPAEAAATPAVAGRPEIPPLPDDPEVSIASLAPDDHAGALRKRLREDDPDAPQMPAAGEAPEPLPEPQAAAGAAQTAETSVSRNALGIPCGPMLSAAPAPAAMIEMTLTAPCRGGQGVEISAGPLNFTATLDMLGTLKAAVPAMSEATALVARFVDGEEVSAEIVTPEAAQFRRVALLWQGAGSGLHIHALEFGADYGEPGHVWAGAPRTPEDALAGRGGFLTRLGDRGGDAHDGQQGAQARFAEVYTFPAEARLRDGVVRLSVEAEITADNCGRDVSGRSLQPGLDGRPEEVAITFAMPACEAVGEFLVLKNLLRDLRVAAN